MTTAPDVLPEIGGWTHERIWNDKPEFCRRVLLLDNCTGWWLTFQQFCQQKGKRIEDECDARTTGGTS